MRARTHTHSHTLRQRQTVLDGWCPGPPIINSDLSVGHVCRTSASWTTFPHARGFYILTSDRRCWITTVNASNLVLPQERSCLRCRMNPLWFSHFVLYCANSSALSEDSTSGAVWVWMHRLLGFFCRPFSTARGCARVNFIITATPVHKQLTARHESVWTMFTLGNAHGSRLGLIGIRVVGIHDCEDSWGAENYAYEPNICSNSGT